MPHSCRSLRPLILLAALAAPLVHAAHPPDRIFRSGFTQALVIDGNAGYPGPLANARVEAHFGNVVATTSTAADGTFRVGIEIDQIDPDAVVELVARGNGAQSHLVWASPLGPANRLLTLAGPTYRIGFDEDPFVYLSPRSTVTAAAARASNDWQPIADAATFWRAVRSRQQATDPLVYALALVARGALPLPQGAPDTFAAVSALAPSKTLRSAYQALGRTDGCWNAPKSDYCDVTTRLPLDARMFPPLAWVPGELYSRAAAFQAIATVVEGIIPNGSGATVLTGNLGNGRAVAATTVALPGGAYELAPADGGIFFSVPSWDYVDGIQVPTREETTRIYVRLTLGPGGQVEFVWSPDTRTVYPENPEIPDRYTPYYQALMPVFSANNPLPAELLNGVPSLAGRRLVLPSPLSRPLDASVDSGSHGYDVHVFGDHTGNAERSGQPFAFQVTAPASFAIDSNGRHAEFRFVNEEEPDVWRVRMHVTGGDGYENVVDGVLVPADAGAFTPERVVGTWRSRINGDRCSGPYGDLGDCSSVFRATFLPDGSATRIYHSDHETGSWTLGSGNSAGRLLSEWVWSYDPPWLYDRRAWELVHENGGRHWVLENLNQVDDWVPLPPITFNPTTRLVRYDRGD